MSMHVCSECFLTPQQHDQRCYEGEEPGRGEHHTHMLSLCCPGCLCGSFEEAHPDSPRADPEMLAILREQEEERAARDTEPAAGGA